VRRGSLAFGNDERPRTNDGFGAVAQLGERLVCNQEATGSIPVSSTRFAMTKFADWPSWLQTAVIAPHAVLGFIMTLVWWPKSLRNRRRFGILATYLLLFYLVMRFVFKA
jgi:hypothetical protein